ncbi:MAG TPA: fumarylacetoacetate hydrolase family protein [Phycisphaerae bacterium]|nr:fumarylacetoacetate hydrolase family protein [Phycisphaerae bacterium]
MPVVRRLAPVDPPNIFAIGRNYREHAEEMKAAETEAEPLVFLKATTSVIGPDDSIVLPRSAPDEVDFEGELAVVIGRTARDVSEDRALDYVLGYCCANDVSARDCQKRRDKQWARGKSFDTFCPLGPAIVTGDSLAVGSLRVRTTLNGRIMQEASTADMIFPVPALVSYLSRQFTLLPGTVILTGTPGGVGAARSPQVFLRPGDEVTVEVEGIGALTNHVVPCA